jgi:mannitol operon repressor
MSDPHKELSDFLAELQMESDRGLALIGAAHLDNQLLTLLQCFFNEGSSAEKLLLKGNAPLGTFSARVDACRALGFIDDFEYRELSLIRKVRNEFAHSGHGTSFSTELIVGLCANFKSHLPESVEFPPARYRYTNSVIASASRLFHRPSAAEKQRRQDKVWVDEGFMRWRNAEEEKPPEGQPVIVMTKTPTNKGAL